MHATQDQNEPTSNEVTEHTTQILHAIQRGESGAAAQLLPLIYDELRRLATKHMAEEKPGQTLQATALVHEAYLRLVKPNQDQQWDSRGHFFAAAAEAMRRILVDNARQKKTVKHGGGLRRVDLEHLDLTIETPVEDLVALSEALDQLAEHAPQKATLVKLRYFAGLTLEEAARALGMSRGTASSHWAFARAWLYQKLHGPEEPMP